MKKFRAVCVIIILILLAMLLTSCAKAVTSKYDRAVCYYGNEVQTYYIVGYQVNNYGIAVETKFGDKLLLSNNLCRLENRNVTYPIRVGSDNE